MERPFITILKTLELHGIGQFTDIAPLLLSIYPIAENADFYLKSETSSKIISFLTIMEKEELLSFDGNKFAGLGTGMSGNIKWLDEIKIMATIGTQGLNSLSADRNQKMIEKVNQSVIETNAATKTNFKLQTIISLLTVVIASLAAWISWLAYQKNH